MRTPPRTTIFPYTTLFRSPKTHRFKSADELARILMDRKIDLDKPVVTYCQSGGRAAVVAFTLELMGGRQVKNYYRSEEHTSELQSHSDLVCRLLLEKKNTA